MTVTCLLCNKEFKVIHWYHLKLVHNITLAEYRRLYPDAPIHDIEVWAERSRNLSKALKGKIPPQYVLDLAHKAAADANRGKHRPDEVRRKISKTRKDKFLKQGYINSPLTRLHISQSRMGHICSEDDKLKKSDGIKRFFDDNPEKREEKSDKMKKVLEDNPILVKNSKTRLEKIWKRDRNTMVSKMRENRRKHLTLHATEILNSIKNFEKDGFRCIPVDHTVVEVQPDFIAFKEDKIFAVEVEVGRHARPKPQKYKDITYFNDIIWIVKEG